MTGPAAPLPSALPGHRVSLVTGRASGPLAGPALSRQRGMRLARAAAGAVVARRLSALCLVAALLAAQSATPARAQGASPPETQNPGATAPLSSIGWLSDSLAADSALRPLPRRPDTATQGAGVAPVSVAPLDAPRPDSIGVVRAAVAGLPEDLWGATTTDQVAATLAQWPNDALPAVWDAVERLLLAELETPRNGGTPGALLIARIDTLLRMGALDAAADLLEAAGTDQPELFRRSFDIALLQGREDTGCATLRDSPGVAPSLQVRIFCLARSGDWPAAALTLETAAALGQLSPLEDALLGRFLDPALAEGVAPLARVPAPTPLEWRMLEAIGERQPTAGLPRAFAHLDRRDTAGWKTRIEATEKLVRWGALPSSALRAVYDERAPAASGGVWERVAAWQALDAALKDDENAAIGPALRAAWREMNAAGLGLAFATAVSPCLEGRALDEPTESLAFRVRLLSPDYEMAALDAPDDADPIAVALARGLAPDADAVAAAQGARSLRVTALGAAFSQPAPATPARVSQLAGAGRFGEAILTALGIVASGGEADPGDLAGAMAFLRRIGFEDTARRAALQIHLLGGPSR